MKILNCLKKIIYLVVFVPLISFSQEKDVNIRIVQDESFKLNDFQTNITLKKKAFKFQILLHNMEGLYVFASIRDSIYRYTETSPIRDFSYLKLLELRETDKFNTNRELNISETGWSYWFYNDTTEYHTFARRVVSIGVNEFVATKAIRQLYDDGEGKSIKFKNIDKPLYLFFIAVKEYDKDGKPMSELMRRKVKIEWTDDN
ncbi:MAG: hypothetical protein H7Y01_04115 [Ferruginibacter sp.]|nr:hypothetical protein [Chitinophagaceae bacterium]